MTTTSTIAAMITVVANRSPAMPSPILRLGNGLRFWFASRTHRFTGRWFVRWGDIALDGSNGSMGVSKAAAVTAWARGLHSTSASAGTSARWGILCRTSRSSGFTTAKSICRGRCVCSGRRWSRLGWMKRRHCYVCVFFDVYEIGKTWWQYSLQSRGIFMLVLLEFVIRNSQCQVLWMMTLVSELCQVCLCSFLSGTAGRSGVCQWWILYRMCQWWMWCDGNKIMSSTGLELSLQLTSLQLCFAHLMIVR